MTVYFIDKWVGETEFSSEYKRCSPLFDSREKAIEYAKKHNLDIFDKRDKYSGGSIYSLTKQEIQ